MHSWDSFISQLRYTKVYYVGELIRQVDMNYRVTSLIASPSLRPLGKTLQLLVAHYVLSFFFFKQKKIKKIN